MRRALLAVSLLLAWPATAAQDLFLSNARVVDPESGKVHERNVLIEGGRIASFPSKPPKDFAGPRLDLGGRWLIPGLVDMHTHSYGNASPGGAMEFTGTLVTAQRMLYCGVTGFLDLFAMEDMILALRARQRDGSGSTPGADIFASGSCFTATDGHCTEYGIPTRIIDTPDDARREVGELAAKRPDVVKIVYDHAPGRRPTLDRPTLEAAIATAREQGIRTVIHIGTWQDARDAVEAGADAVTHVPAGGVVPDDLVALMRERGTRIIPTLTVQSELAGLLADPGRLDDPLLQAVASTTLITAYRQVEESDTRTARWVERQRASRETVLSSVGKLARGGVTVLAGTDAGNLGVFQGYSLHRELQLLVEAGLTPAQALAAATTAAGDFLGLSLGVSRGDVANLVVLGGSPLEDIGNTRMIHRVIHHGRVVDREALLPDSGKPRPGRRSS